MVQCPGLSPPTLEVPNTLPEHQDPAKPMAQKKRKRENTTTTNNKNNQKTKKTNRLNPRTNGKSIPIQTKSHKEAYAYTFTKGEKGKNIYIYVYKNEEKGRKQPNQ